MTRMHAFVLVCTVALVSLASARDILEDTDLTTMMVGSTEVLIEPGAMLVDPAPVPDDAAVKAMSLPIPVPLNTERCVDIPAQCRAAGGCLEVGFSQPPSAPGCGPSSACASTQVLQACVAHGTPGPPSPTPTNPAWPIVAWPGPAVVPTSSDSFCPWPGISCSSTPPKTIDPLQQYACHSGVYIYQKIGTSLATSQRVGLWSANLFGDGETCASSWRFCLKTFSYRPTPSASPITGTYGDPSITADPGQRYKITVPRLQADGSPLTSSQLLTVGGGSAVYECKLSFDSQKKYTLAYCNL